MPEDSIGGSNGRPFQRRRALRTSLTKAQRIVFLDHLAATANVKRSAEAVGRKAPTLYGMKQRDPEFAAAWQVALEAGYARIEEELLAHALGDATTDYVPGESEVESARPFDPNLALKLLSQRDARRPRRFHGPSYSRAPAAEARKELTRLLDGLAKRLGNAR